MHIKILIFTYLLDYCLAESLVDFLIPSNIHENILDDNVILKSTIGDLRGVRREARLQKGGFTRQILSWYQFPYGSAEEKFKKPTNFNRPWNGTENFTKFNKNKICLQSNGNGRDDCLFMSLHKPFPQFDDPNDKRRYPLMIFVHGGSYSSGDGMKPIGFTSTTNNYFYDPIMLVEQDIMVVNIQYRLNILGGIDFNQLEQDFNNPNLPHGNLFVYDILKGLDFLLENADNFDFNPKKITVLGQSAGGAMVNLLGAIPEFTDKIARIISMSGNLAMPILYHNTTQSNFPAVREVASKVHCLYPDSESTFNCLKNERDSEEIRFLNHPNITWNPVYDRELIELQDPFQQIDTYSKNIDYMVGSVVGDSLLFLLPFSNGKQGMDEAIEGFLSKISPDPINDRNFLNDLMRHWMRYYDQEKRNLDKDDWKFESYRRGLLYAMQGLIFDGSAFSVANHHDAITGRNGGKTYLYSLNVPTAIEKLSFRDWDIHDLLPYCNTIDSHYPEEGELETPQDCGCIHSEDLFYVLGHIQLLSTQLVKKFKSKPKLELSERLLQNIAEFVKNGKPSDWEEFDQTNPQYKEFKAKKEFRVESDRMKKADRGRGSFITLVS